MNEMNREMRRMSEREERLAKKADRNIGRHQSGEKVSRFRRIANYLGEVRTELKELIGQVIRHYLHLLLSLLLLLPFLLFLFLEWTLVLKIH